MKLCGEFIVRQVMDNIVAIPVGQTALRLNGMIMLNDVSKTIWECLEQGCDLESVVTAVTDAFDVSAEEAQKDIAEFLGNLKEMNIL